MSVLSTSKKAAAAGSCAGGGYPTSATAADASPASAAWVFRLGRPRPRRGAAFPPDLPSGSPDLPPGSPESPDLPPGSPESPDWPSESPDLPPGSPESPHLPPGPPDLSSRDGTGEVSRPSSCLMCIEPTGAGHGRARAGMTAGQPLVKSSSQPSHRIRIIAPRRAPREEIFTSLLAAFTGAVVAVGGPIAPASGCARTPRPDL